jgi:DNA gyrase/topoisomerase IV subunit B
MSDEIIDWPTILRARAKELRERANSIPGTEGGTHALKIAEELGRLCNTYAPKAKHAKGSP